MEKPNKRHTIVVGYIFKDWIHFFCLVFNNATKTSVPAFAVIVGCVILNTTNTCSRQLFNSDYHNIFYSFAT